MSLETIVSKMIAANEPESNIAKVIKYHKKDSSKINCEKCNHSWKVADGGNDLYTCHECGYNNKSPLKAVGTCPDGSEPDEFGKCNQDKELESAKDAMMSNINKDLEAKKRNRIDRSFAQKMSAQAPSNISNDNIDNSQEEILKRRRKCPEGYQKDKSGECVPIENIQTEQLEEVIVEGRKIKPEVDKVAEEQARDFYSDKYNQGTTGRNKKLTNEDLDSFKKLAVDTRLKNQKFEKELKPSLFRVELKKKIDNLLERAKLIEDNNRGGYAAPKIRLKENKDLLNARDEYLKTGKWPFTLEETAEIEQQVQIDYDKALREFTEDVPNSVRIYNEAFLNSQDDSVKKETEEVNTRIENNFNTLDVLNEEFISLQESDGFISDPKRAAEIWSQANVILEEFEADKENLLRLATETNDLQASIDYTRRDHSISTRLSNVIKTGLTEMALAGVETLNVITGENPDAGLGIDLGSIADGLTSDLQNQKDFAKDFLPKPIAVGDIDNIDDVGNYISDTWVNFVNSGIVMGIGSVLPGAAAPLFFSMGYSSRLSRFLLAEQAAKKALPELKKRLENQKSFMPGEKEALIKQIAEFEKDLNVSNLVKIPTSIIGGFAEGAGEKFGSLAILNQAARWKKALPTKAFNEGIKTAVFQGTETLGRGAVRENVSENLTNVIQNWADINLADENKSYFEGADETTASAILLGGGLAVVPASRIARSAILDVVSSKEQKTRAEQNLAKIDELAITYNNLKQKGPSNGDKQTVNNYNKNLETIKNQMDSLIEETILDQDITASRFLKLSFDQQQEVMEKDRKMRAINKEWKAVTQDGTIPESTKSVIREGLQKEFNDLDSSKRQIIESVDQRLQETIPVEGLTEGDQIRNQMQSDVAVQKIKQANKTDKFANWISSITEAEVKLVNEFAKNAKEGETITLEDGTVLDKSKAELISKNSEIKDDGSSVEFKTGFFDPASKGIVVFSQRSGLANKGTAIHEYVHAALDNAGFTTEQYKKIRDGLETTLNEKVESGEITNGQRNRILSQLETYDNTATEKSEDGTTKDKTSVRDQEILSAISDAIFEDIITSEDTSILQKISNTVSDAVNTLMGRDSASNLNIATAEDAFQFVKDFNNKLLKDGKSTNIRAGVIEEQPATEQDVLDSKITIDNLLDKYGDKTTLIEQSLLKTPQGKETFDFTKSEFGESIGGLVETITKRLYDPVLPDLKRATSRDQFKQDLVSQAATIISNEFDPNKQDLGKFTTNRLNLRANRIASETFEQKITDDVTEAKAVSTDEKAADEVTKRKPITEALNLKELKESVNKNAELGIVKIENTLDNKDLSDVKKINAIRKSIGGLFEKQYFKEIGKVLGKNTKTSDDFSKYLNNNFETLSYAATNNIDFQKGNNIASDWNTNPPTKEEFLDYYEGKDILPSQPRSVKSDRKKSLINAVARQMANDGLTNYVKENPKVAKIFKQKYQVPLASNVILPKASLQTLSGIPGFRDGKGFPALNVWEKLGAETTIGFNLSKKDGRENAIKAMEFALTEGNVPLDAFATGGLMINSSPRFFKEQEDAYKNAKKEYKKNPTAKNKKNVEVANETRLGLRDEFAADMNKMIDRIKKDGKVRYLTGAAKGWTKSKYSFNTLGNTLPKIKESFKNGKVDKNNNVNLAMFEQTMMPLYDLVSNDPSMVNLVMMLTNTSNGGSNLWFRQGAEVVGYSDFLLPGKKDKRGIEWEHAMQANNARLFLLNSAINKVPWGVVYPAVKRNYKVIALDKSLDNVLKASNRSNNMGEGWNVYKDSWLSRYFSPEVLLKGGIDPKTIIGLNGESLATMYNIDSAGQPLVLSSKSRIFYEDGDGVSQIESPLSREFNKMLERTKGVKAEAVYSDARAAKMGTKKGFQVFVPYSAEDFLGLIYPTLGKGEQGNKDLKWWKDNVMTPYNDGMTNFESAKQAAMIEWNQIKDQIKETPANLGKKAVRDFSNEDAIRVYLWDQKGVVPDGLSKKDISALTKHIKDNPELQDFANQVAGLNINGYPDPTKGWLAGTITTDLVNHVNTSTRSEMLEPWQQAIDEIYSKDNKNKLRATYGDKYIEALDDALYRMKTGRNRPSGANRITNNWLNWVNDSVGTIMFFNQRSAILQTISSINFINWTDNNPAAAAKAFANQKQYWSDFTELFNSDFLKQRRSGLKTDVNADEIAQQAASSTNKVRAGLSWLLKKGFLPTQIADSFAIASGGSTFYRNRINSLIKEGMSEADAKKQAFSDFRDSANESQQSSDPSRISMEQASSLGRVILAFANTPIQYTRLTKRAVQDLAAGRGDWKSNVSKILYYGAVQNIIFTTLQQAMFGMLFSDDDDEFQDDKKDKAVFNIANSTADTFLRGSGVAGAFVAMLKNMALEIKKQSDKKTPDYTNVADKLFSVSPPIDSKFRKLKSAGRTFTYKQELQKMRDRGVALDNPALMAIAQVISAFGNIPADRVLRKLNNIVESTNSENAIWQRIALAMGWGEWELGITDRKTKEEKAERKSFQDLEKSISKVIKIRKKEEAKEAKEDKKTPIKALEAGVLGEANRDGSITVAKGLSKEKRKEVIRHEKVHQKEISSGKLDYDDNFVYYGKKKYERSNGKIMHNGKAKIEGDHSLPWEKVAHKH